MDTKTRLHALGEAFRESLLGDVTPFWLRHSLDREHGGYLTSLDRRGQVYDTDKFVWMQAREVWTFSMLFNRVEPKSEWLEAARLGAEFLARFGHDPEGRWYYALDRQGRPLMQPFTIFTDAFAAMGFAEYARTTGDPRAERIARDSHRAYREDKSTPKGRFSKAVPGARPLMPLATRMMDLNLLLEMDWMLPPEEARDAARACLMEIEGLLGDEQRGMLFENVDSDGGHPDCFEGRMLNPGHGLETLWMAMAAARRWGDEGRLPAFVCAATSTMEAG